MIRRCCSVRRGGERHYDGNASLSPSIPCRQYSCTPPPIPYTPPRTSAALPVPASAFSAGHSFHQKRKKERKMKLIKLVLLISKDPVWVSYRKSNTVTRATPTLPLSPIFKQRLGSSHSEISVEGVRFRPICGIKKCRLLGKCAPAPCLISPPSHGCAELNNLTSGWCVSFDFLCFLSLPVTKWREKWREWVSGKGCYW